jgi:aspartyl-tRNA(Asn)/glutamyl-tRNA(Gln) amidotransferase subunit A
MTTTTDLCYLSLHELAGRMRAKEVSPVEATEAVLERIERLNPKLNAYITVMADQALAEARTAAGEIAAGKYRGPLHGVPIGVKDLCQTKGARTTAGSSILADWVPDEDATVIHKLRGAGAVIVGKTHLHEWAFGATGLNPHYGAAHNPWNLDCITGGSSSGSGAAVAAGMCFAALGSDTGGSIRIPSSLCGVTGIKPTYGRVSTRNVIALSWSLDHIGPMARSARDCALVLAAIAGHDPAEPTSADVPVDDYAAPIEGGLRGLRIGVPANAFEQAEPEVSSIVQEAIAMLERLGARVEHIDLPQLDGLWTSASLALIAEAAAYHKENIERRPQDYGADVMQRLQGGLDMKAVDLARSYRAMIEARHSCDDVLLKDLDLLALPATQRTSVPIEEAKQADPTLGLTRLTAQFDVTGQPACSVPCGWTKAGLPVGLQLVGRYFQEGTVLRAAHAFETESGVPRPQPPVD